LVSTQPIAQTPTSSLPVTTLLIFSADPRLSFFGKPERLKLIAPGYFLRKIFCTIKSTIQHDMTDIVGHTNIFQGVAVHDHKVGKFANLNGLTNSDAYALVM
jgi:hypothetical protein